MTALPRLFVHEFFSGGGWQSDDLPADLATEGGAMLCSLLADFRAWGAVRTITTLDKRLAALPLLADDVIKITPDQHAATFSSVLDQCDAALIIAPETEGILARLSTQVQEAKVLLLGSSPEAVMIAANKWTCYQRFLQSGLPTPPTRLSSVATAPLMAREIGYPLVIKAIDGVGCEGVCMVANESELAAALNILRQATYREELILQGFINGTHASVSLLVVDGQSFPLSLNRQTITAGCPFVYQGGTVPLIHPSKERACSIAQAAVGQLPGLKGYVGVDIILADGDIWVIEINPRLTTSYLGLRRVLRLNFAQAIWQACRQGVLPKEAPLEGQVTFRKDNL
jgi:predicted ATP-grasp superfamily ATP-dependent carboligase